MAGDCAVVKTGQGPEDGTGLPANLGCFDLLRLVHSRGMYSFRDVGALALGPSNANGGAEGDTAAAFPTLPCGLDLSLAGDSENHGAR